MLMKVLLKETELSSFTMLHLQGWIEALDLILDSEDCPFDTADELAIQLDSWRAEYQRNCGNHSAAQEPILITVYGNEIILVCNQETGEYLKLTVITQPCNQETY